MSKLSSSIMEKQVNSTACWVSVARFCLNALDVPVPGIKELATQFQKKNSGSASIMDGAGKPEQIIHELSENAGMKYECTSYKFDKTPSRKDIQSLANVINDGRPVICELCIKTRAEFKHAVVLYAAEQRGEDILFKFKDPARKENANTAIEILGQQLFDSGFVYMENLRVNEYDQMKQVWAYSKRVIVMKKAA